MSGSNASLSLKHTGPLFLVVVVVVVVAVVVFVVVVFGVFLSFARPYDRKTRRYTIFSLP